MKSTTEEENGPNPDWLKRYGRGCGPKLNLLRWKLYQKAKLEPNFRFYALYDRIYRKDTLHAAWLGVTRESKAAGIDDETRETVESKEGGVEKFLDQLHEELKSKTYRPKPVKRVYISKSPTKKRPLGIGCLRDRVVEKATLLILEAIFEADFRDCSYGFRPGRNQHKATQQVREHLSNGYTEVYDADLEGYFDNIPWEKLFKALEIRIVDRSVLRLIKMWLERPIIEVDNGKQKPPSKPKSGTAQGSVISPLLSNIYLHWFDTFFAQTTGPEAWANAKIVRFADDFVILARYQGPRINDWVRRTIGERMGLKLNEAKSSIVKLSKTGDALCFLGFEIKSKPCRWRKGHYYWSQSPSKKALKKAREEIKLRTESRLCFMPIMEMIEELNTFLKGWEGYFKEGYPSEAFSDINYYTNGRVIKHLKRRSQRGYKKPVDLSWYRHLQNLGLHRLGGKST